MVKRLPSGCRERLRQKPDMGGWRGPLKTSGLQRLLVMLEGEPFEEILAQPTWGLPSCRGGSTAHLSS